MLRRFRKNNTEVEAVQWDGSDGSLAEIKNLLGEKADKVLNPDPDSRTFHMVVRNGETPIYMTDWIVKDMGHFFVVSDNIFYDFFTEIE